MVVSFLEHCLFFQPHSVKVISVFKWLSGSLLGIQGFMLSHSSALCFHSVVHVVYPAVVLPRLWSHMSLFSTLGVIVSLRHGSVNPLGAAGLLLP